MTGSRTCRNIYSHTACSWNRGHSVHNKTVYWEQQQQNCTLCNSNKVVYYATQQNCKLCNNSKIVYYSTTTTNTVSGQDILILTFKLFVVQGHTIRMEIEAKANNRRLFLGENGGPLILCSRRIDKGGPGQCYIKMSFVSNGSVTSNFYTVY